MLHERQERPAPWDTESGGPPALLGFDRLLRFHRERAGLTQQSLAGLSTIGARTIRDLESGRSRARTRTLELLADGLRLQGRVRTRFVEAGLAGRADPPEPRASFAAPELYNPLVGRDVEVNAMVEAFASGRRRVISVCGLPGVGKTRLAAEIATRLSAQHGWPVTWTVLGATGFAGAVPRPVAGACSPPDPADDHHGGGRQAALLVLDDVRDGADLAGLGSVLASSTGLRVLVTSRSLCRLSGLQPTVLPPLETPGCEWDGPARRTPDPLPVVLDRLGRVPAIHLLVDRLREVRTDFALDRANARALVAVSRRSDGLPLVLELLASRSRVLSLDELARMSEGELLGLTVTGRAGEGDGSVGDLFGASMEQLDSRQRAVLTELARLRCDRSVADVAAALHRSVADLVDDLTVLIGYGLVGTCPGEPSTTLVIPGLLRASLAGSWRAFPAASQTRVRGDCVPGPAAAGS